MTGVPLPGGGTLYGSTPATIGLTETEVLNIAYPVGSLATINAPYASALAGATFPEQGASGGSFLAYDKASTESAVFALGSFVPITWRTVQLYIEVFNLNAGTGDVRWSVNVNSGGEQATTVSYPTPFASVVSLMAGGPFALDENTIDGVDKYGATVVVSRIGGNGADTLDGDASLSSLHAVRVT